MPLKYSIGGSIIIIILAFVGFHFFSRSSAAPEQAQVTHVQIASIASLSSASGPIPVTGKVTSLSEATILAQSSGEIISLPHAIGDHVAAGGVIGTFENASQQAALLSAQGAYDAAQAAYAKMTGTAAANTNLSSTQAAQNAANAQTSAITSLQSVAALLDDAIHTKIDTLFVNPRSTTPTLIQATIPDSQLVVSIQSERLQLERVLEDANTRANAKGDIDADITSVTADAQTVLVFLNDVTKAFNQAVPNQNVSAATIAAAQGTAAAARSEVMGVFSTLSAAKAAYDSAQTGAQTAANAAGAGTTNDIAASQAQVKQALGGLNSAKANLEKTIIRSPISGTIVSLPITKGDFVSAFSQVAQVSNPGALQIETYVTPSDAKTLTVGGKAIINGTVNGVITSLAPALDPTVGKIPVKVGIVGDQSKLTDGDTVTLSLDRSGTSGKTKANAQILIPIAAIKMTPTAPVVFTVASSTLVANQVTLGPILGGQVTIVSGVTPETDIVTDARGLSDGQVVIVDEQ